MDFYEALRARALASGELVALVGTRIDWDERPQGKPLPAVTLQVITDADDQTYEGPQALRETLIQADIWAGTRKEVSPIKAALEEALLAAVIIGDRRFEQSFVAGSRDSSERPEEGGTVFRTSLDLSVWHAPL